VDEIAYRDLQPGEVIQAGDEWKSMEGGTACWQGYHSDMIGKTLSEFCVCKARRPHNITELLRQRDQAAHEYRLAREALTCEQAAHKITMANGLQACRERDDARQASQMARASLEETRLAREFVIEERNEAERLLSEERAVHEQTGVDRDRLIVELNECQQQRQHLAAALEELQRRRDTAEAGYQTNTLTVGEVVGNILSALEIAGHALEYLADVGANEEAGHYCGFSAAVAVVKQIKESAK
jgi:hypothetical protein